MEGYEHGRDAETGDKQERTGLVPSSARFVWSSTQQYRPYDQELDCFIQ